MAASMEDQSEADQETHKILQDISKQFLQMVPIRRIKWKVKYLRETFATTTRQPKHLTHIERVCSEIYLHHPTVDGEEIGFDVQRMLLNATIMNPICKKYPPSLSYRKAFMKQIINKPDDQTVSLQESTHLISQGTTGLSTWQAALHLAEWIFENSKTLTNKSVLELGSGLGLTGICVCKCCQLKSYTFTDCHPQVLFLLMKNIELNFLNSKKPELSKLEHGNKNTSKDNKMMKSIRRQLSVNAEPNICSDSAEIMDISYTSSASQEEEDNEEDDNEIFEDLNKFSPCSTSWIRNDKDSLYRLKVDDKIRLCQFDWEESIDSLSKAITPDVILAAEIFVFFTDVVYDKTIIPALVNVLRCLLSFDLSNGQRPVAYVTSTIRNEDTRDHFLITLANEGLVYEMMEPPKQRIFHYEDTIPIEILKIQYLK
ncbi:hypothetical protein KUTeg_003152 [Tegillarca granosa]|uniref:FAM86 N-terminal domain-containing protein n=1 Tax=Tegillarca granosa TaxID=220873 RepID=A0ABQ9FMX6_TEGGR|nr:hypothetical protein KUTeg_003152 [Tegillarca granosa]